MPGIGGALCPQLHSKPKTAFLPPFYRWGLRSIDDHTAWKWPSWDLNQSLLGSTCQHTNMVSEGHLFLGEPGQRAVAKSLSWQIRLRGPHNSPVPTQHSVEGEGQTENARQLVHPAHLGTARGWRECCLPADPPFVPFPIHLSHQAAPEPSSMGSCPWMKSKMLGLIYMAQALIRPGLCLDS